jgi:hypothetical protein
MNRGVILLLVLGLAGCAGTPKQTPNDDPQPRSLPTSVVNGGVCEPTTFPGLPSDAGCLTGLDGDANGDGSSDTFIVFATLGGDDRPRRWFVGLQTSATLMTTRLPAGNDFTYPRVVGVADIDEDGRDELFVKAFDLAGHGTNWQSLILLVERDGRLRPVTYEGQPLPLRVGGPSRTGEGVECSGGRVALLRAGAQSRDNTEWDYSVRLFDIEGTQARFIERTSGRLSIEDYNDPALDPYYRLDCGGLRYPDV